MKRLGGGSIRLLPWFLVVGLSIPAGAAARSHPISFAPFRVAGTNGYQAEIYADSDARNGERGTRPTVFVSIWNNRSQTVYEAPGRVDENGYSADFGRFGSVNVDYEHRPSRSVTDCRGNQRAETHAHYTGSVEFHGDRHFTEVDYPRLDAGQVNQYEQICWVAGTGGKGAHLHALSRYATVDAYANGKRGSVRFFAQTEYRLGSMIIFRDLQAFGSPGDFVRSRRFSSARITPPAPFHGSLSYRRLHANDDLGRLRGDLTVDFPGYPRFPLAVRPTLAFLEPGGCTIRVAPRRVGPPIPCL